MLRPHEAAKRCLTDTVMLALCSWAVILPALQIFLLRQETVFALLLTLIFSVVLSIVPQFKKKLRPIVYLLLAALFGLWAYRGQLPAAFIEVIKALAARGQVNPLISLYADLFIPAAILGVCLYMRLLIQGEPSFSAPLLLSNVLMLWFSGARQGIADFFPAMVAVPLLYVHTSYLQDRSLTAGDRPKSRNFLKAVPIALLIAALAMALTPPARLTNPTLEKKADELRQWINDYFFFTDTRENFSLSSLGYQPMGDKGLGGKPAISNIPVLEVKTDKKVYLRGSIKDRYDGRQWYDSLSNERYGYTSFRFKALRDSLLDDHLPEDTQREDKLSLSVRLLSPLPSTLFVPQRLRSLSLSEGMVAYLNAASELFITRNLQAGDHYDLAYEPYVAGTKQTDALAQSLGGSQDAGYDSLMAAYTQLPAHLQPNGQVTRLAAQIAGKETDPYRKALLIRNYLKENFTYTLDVPPAPEDLDFTSHFLFEIKKGYCTYFATALTVLARTQGLPSRYVEGFVATPGADGLPAVLTGQQAHAWTEIYIPALGWVTFDATATTGETPPNPDNEPDNAPGDEPDDSPPEGNEPEQTPTPQDEPEPQPSQEPENEGRQESPSPQPNPQTENSPPPEESPLPEAGGPKSKAWLWLIVSLALAVLLVWRLRQSQPHRRAQKAKDETQKLLIYWQSFSLALFYGGKPMQESETLRDYALRISPDDESLYRLSEAVSGVLYGRKKASSEEVTLASLSYQSAYAALSPMARLKMLGKRLWLDAVGHISVGWTFVSTSLENAFKGLSHRFRQAWTDGIAYLRGIFKKR